MASGSCSVAHRKPWKHDVFLSFQGEDTRRTFTSHLFNYLEEKGVNTFIDDNLPRGEDISLQLIDTIKSSRISVIVLSSNYAESRWCLQELAEIMECRKKSPGQVVLPVFYDVNPSDVRKQTGPFEKHFAKHEQDKDKERVTQWRVALAEAGSLSGWDITNSANGPEAKIVRKIARRICDELNNTYLDVAKYPVGLEYRVLQVNKYLYDGSDDVRFIVIWGMGGIGKTTLAKAVYNQFFHTFEAKSFLANVGENATQHNGLVQLQQQLLYDVLKFQETHVENIHRGAIVIEERLRTRRVLVVLDDVTHRDQLNALAREREWFGSGSRIIITTRDPDSVKEIKPEYVYMLHTWNDEESLELFSRHAFGDSHPQDEFIELSRAVVRYCQGLPLALEVLGAHLLDKSAREWKRELEKLRRTPHKDVQKILKISFDALESDNEKELFLDIACFFVGWDKDLVHKILEACNVDVELGLDVLSRRSLVKILPGETRSRIEMHDMIRDMGREIVRRESPRNPGERSRLISSDDIITTMRSRLGTDVVEGIAFYSSEPTNQKLLMDKVDAKAFEGMRRLRLLKLDKLDVDGDYGLISKEIRWLHWHGFPRSCLPDAFYMENLVVIDIQYSKLRTIWKTAKLLGNLKVLNLSHSYFFSGSPNFSKTPNLEELIMENCKELKGIDGSIGLLERLVSVNLKNCKKLENLPDSICRVKSLRTLDISGCSKMSRLPEDFGGLESLTEFLADGVPIPRLPLSFANLMNLSKLSLYGYNKSKSSSISALISAWLPKMGPSKENNRFITSLSGLTSITQLYLEHCNLSDQALLEGFGTLRSLYMLGIKECDVCRFPSSMSSLKKLRLVAMIDCPMLESFPDMPPSATVEYRNCPRLSEKLSPKSILSLLKFSRLANHRDDQFWGILLYITTVSNIPGWFQYQSEGASLSFEFPSCHAGELSRIFVLFVVGPANQGSRTIVSRLSVTIRTIRGCATIRSSTASRIEEDRIGALSFAPSTIVGDAQYAGVNVALDVRYDSDCYAVKRVGVHLEVGKKCPSCCLADVDDAEETDDVRSPVEDLPEDGAADLTMKDGCVPEFRLHSNLFDVTRDG